MDLRFRSIKCIRFLIIYRPPDSNYIAFFQDFSRLLEQVHAEPTSHIIIAGDFNFHIDDPDNQHALQFLDLLDFSNLRQHVIEDTYIHGHTLDLVISRSDDLLINSYNIMDPGLSDHYAVLCELRLQKSNFERKPVNSRNLRTLRMESFCTDFIDAFPDEQCTDLSSLVDKYDSTLLSLVDKHVPVKHRWITVRPTAIWYTPEVTEQKRIRRNLERSGA